MMMIIYFFFLTICTHFATDHVQACLLYNSADGVNILTELNATQFLVNKGYPNTRQKIHLVLFYASWCGHCKRMVPIFKQFLAKANRSWNKNLIDISAVACAEDDRKAKWSSFCEQYKVNAVPEFRLISTSPDQSTNGTIDIGTSISPITTYTIEMFYSSVVKSINEFKPSKCSTPQLPPRWPHFSALSFDQLISLIDVKNLDYSRKTVIVVVVEWPDSITGRELMLRFGDGSEIKNRQMSLYRTVYRSWEEPEINKWASLLGQLTGQLVPPFLLILDNQTPKQLYFVLKPQDLSFRPEDEADYFANFISEKL